VTRVVIHSRQTLFEDRFRVLEAMLRYQRPGGEMSAVVRRVSVERGDAAAAVVFDPTARVALMTRQFRFPTYDNGPGWMLEVVAGEIEPGESPETAIRREILEEIGYDVLSLEHIVTFYPSPGGSSERVHLFGARVGSELRVKPAGGNLDEEEDIELMTFPLDGLDALLASGEIIDAKSIIGLHWLARRLRAPGDPDGTRQ
jgi:nudix-type nucleoside diphosphatase (YffH/AdpP family)